MFRALANLILLVIGNAVGIIAASIILPGFHVNIGAVTIAVLFFTGIHVLLSPFVIKVALQYLPALRGGIALVTTLVSLLLTTLFTNGLSLDDISTWMLAPLIIWAATVLAGVLLPMVLFKKILTSNDVATKKGQGPTVL